MTVSAYLAGRTLGYWIMMSRTIVTADMRTKHMCLLHLGCPRVVHLVAYAAAGALHLAW